MANGLYDDDEEEDEDLLDDSDEDEDEFVQRSSVIIEEVNDDEHGLAQVTAAKVQFGKLHGQSCTQLDVWDLTCAAFL